MLNVCVFCYIRIPIILRLYPVLGNLHPKIYSAEQTSAPSNNKEMHGDLFKGLLIRVDPPTFSV